MRLIKVFRNSLLSLIFLGMMGGILNTNVADAKYSRRPYRYFRRINHTHNNRHGKFIRYRKSSSYYSRNKSFHYYVNKHNSYYYKLRRSKKNYKRTDRHKSRITQKSHQRVKNYNKIKKSKRLKRSPKRNNKNPQSINIIGPNNTAVQSHSLANSRIIPQIHNQTIDDINADRQANHLLPVMDNPFMDKIAEMRAKQNLNQFTYYDGSNNNEPYELEDAKVLGIQFGKGNYQFTENLINSALNTRVLASPNGTPTYYNHNGIEMADNANDYFVNYDTNSNPNSLFNILYKPWQNVGVGVANKGNIYVITEEFATTVTQNNNNQ